MSEGHYSQRNEQEVILELVGDHRGSFLDIGAYDGKTFSNTMALVERGWKGVLVEPSPLPFKSMLELHGENPRLRLVNAAVGLERGLTKFWPTDDAVSTTHSPNYEKWKDTAKFFQPYYVAQVTFGELLAMFADVLLPDLGVLNIDVEGVSVELLTHFPFLLFRPRIICIEHDQKVQTILDLLVADSSGKGYSVHLANEENLILFRGWE
jgi:FkbM family methyltransferase